MQFVYSNSCWPLLNEYMNINFFQFALNHFATGNAFDIEIIVYLLPTNEFP